MGVSHRVLLRAHSKHWGNTREERGWPPTLLLTLLRSASFAICLPKRRIPLQFRYTSCSLPQTPIQKFSLHQFISPEGCIPLTLGTGPAFGWLCLSLGKTVPIKDSRCARFFHLLTDNAQHPKTKHLRNLWENFISVWTEHSSSGLTVIHPLAAMGMNHSSMMQRSGTCELYMSCCPTSTVNEESHRICEFCAYFLFSEMHISKYILQ